MKKTATYLVVATVVLPLTAHAASVSSYFGNWKVVKIAGYADISVGEEIAKKGLGQTVVISATSIMLPDAPCQGADVKLNVINVDKLLQDDWKATREDIDVAPYRMGKTAHHIDSSCADGIVLDRDHLLMTDAGAFYVVERDK